MALTHLGDAYRDSGEADAARTAWHEALRILDGMNHPSAEQVLSKLAALDSHAAPNG